METISRGEGRLGRIYERLRKRSWREKAWAGRQREHESYVRGVLDALNECRDIAETTSE